MLVDSNGGDVNTTGCEETAFCHPSLLWIPIVTKECGTHRTKPRRQSLLKLYYRQNTGYITM